MTQQEQNKMLKLAADVQINTATKKQAFKPLHENLQAARVRFAQALRYFSEHLYRMKFEDKPEFAAGTMGIDKYWRVSYDPTYVDTLNVKQAVFAIYHEMFHPLDNFWERMGDRDPKFFNYAHDLQINSHRRKEIAMWQADGLDCPMELPPNILLPDDPKFGFPDCLQAEEYYDLLIKKFGDPNDPKEPTKRGFPGDLPKPCGCDDKDGEGDPSDPTGKISEGEGEIMKRRIAESLDEFKKSRGYLPGDLNLLVERILRPVFDPYKELRVAAKNAIIAARRKEDFTFARPSRRSYGSVIMPGQISHLPVAAVAVDTSGSMCSPETLARCMAETKAVLDYYRGKCFVHVLSVDTKLQNVQKVFNANAIQFKGGGGTEMSAAFEAAVELKPRPDVFILITDGYTDWPVAAPKGMKCIVICLTEREVPSWAKCIRILE